MITAVLPIITVEFPDELNFDCAHCELASEYHGKPVCGVIEGHAPCELSGRRWNCPLREIKGEKE